MTSAFLLTAKLAVVVVVVVVVEDPLVVAWVLMELSFNGELKLKHQDIE